MSVKEAKKLAKQIYSGRKRLSGETYYEHALEIAQRLKDYGIKGENTLTAAILHHALDKDEGKSLEKVHKINKEAAKLLEKYKKLTEIDIKVDSLTNQNEKYLMQTLVNLVRDVRALIIRTVDKLHSLENSWALDKKGREKAALKALNLYAPLAKILGVSQIATELEDTAFKILHPREYFNLKQIVRKRSWGTKKLFKEVEDFLTEILREQGLKNFQIQYRTKGFYSLYKKLERYKQQKKEIGSNLENIYDLFALRVIVGTVEECYLVENLLTRLWDYLPEERDDYIKNPRNTGYQSLHNAFQISNDFTLEVQIRTHEMHKQAEFGISSHLLYKIGDKGAESKAVKEFKDYLKKHPNWFKALNFWEISKDKGYKPKTPFKNKVYAFTPKGDIIELPEEASVVDFAYAVHTEIGNRCVGAFVNNKIVKLEHMLKTGDTVKVKVGNKKKKPSKDWLDFVKTRRAKIQINKAWKD